MICQTLTACCVELNINVCTGRYLTEVSIDGVFKEQLEFQTEHQLTHWAGANFPFAGGNLYVHIQPREPCHNQQVLELADKLSRHGLMIGISRRRTVCRSQHWRLQ